MDIKPKRPWFRYSLRTLLVFVTIVSAGFGWLGMIVRAKQREREAVKAIENAGGYVHYDYQRLEHGVFATSRTRRGLAWMQKLLGDDFFSDVVVVGFGFKTTDVDLRHLATLKRLEFVDLGNTRTSDVGLVHLRHLNELKRLRLDRTAVTDAGVEELQKALPNLEIIR